MMKAYCFKLYKSKRNRKLHQQIDAAGLIYNHCIAIHKRYYRLFHKSLNANKLKKHLAKLKRLQRFSYLQEIGSQAVQDIAERIDRAYRLFFNNLKRKVRTAPPSFKKIRKYKSFTLKQTGWKLDQQTQSIIINKQKYRYFKSREIDGRIKTVTIKRDTLGDIYAYFVCDIGIQPEVLIRTGKSVGFDFGLKRFLTASDGNDIDAPLPLFRNLKRLKAASRKLSKKQKGSRNRRKARMALARLHKKISNQRKDFHFQLANRLCGKYAIICIEDLNIKAMQRLWGRKITDLAFADFVKILEYEASKTGTEIVKVDRFYASSQLCSVCGYQNPEVKNLRIRKWACQNCGKEHDRDRNASLNILTAGTSAALGKAS